MQQAERRLRGERETETPCLSLSLSAPVLLALTPRTSALRKGTYAPLSMWSALATCPTPLPRPVLLACSAGWGTRQGTDDPDGAPQFAYQSNPVGKSSLLGSDVASCKPPNQNQIVRFHSFLTPLLRIPRYRNENEPLWSTAKHGSTPAALHRPAGGISKNSGSEQARYQLDR